ncbi:MAG: phosphatase PAP2 family protein [Nanoarchaeota archaeon]
MILTLIFFFIGNYELFLRLTIGGIAIFIIAIIIRLLYFKERPNKEPYNNLFEKIDAGAFPSLHSARITFITLVIIYSTQNFLLSMFLIIICVFVYYSRIYLKKHDYIDVIGGIIIGIIFWYFIVGLPINL